MSVEYVENCFRFDYWVAPMYMIHQVSIAVFLAIPSRFCFYLSPIRRQRVIPAIQGEGKLSVEKVSFISEVACPD